MAPFKDYEVRLKIMDSLFLNGCEPQSLILYHSGEEGVHAAQGGWGGPPGEKQLEEGEVILIEFDPKYLGYRAQFNQPFHVGQPQKEWFDLFRVAEESFYNGLKVLKPGITSGELDEAFMSPIKKTGYIVRNPAFHGMALSLEMPMGIFSGQPGYKPDNSFLIKPGMVLEFEPHVVSRDEKKGIHIGSPVLVTQEGCRLLTKGWEPEFIGV